MSVPCAHPQDESTRIGRIQTVANAATSWLDVHAGESGAAFEVHADLPRTVQFVARMGALIDHPFDATRARVLEQGAGRRTLYGG